jgi:hypothetical protein
MTLVQADGDNTVQPFQGALQKLAEKRGRPVLSLVAEMDPNGIEILRMIVGRLSGSDQLTVLLESPGGQIEHAHRMLLAMRRHVSDVEVLVPSWAKSAATFFCLGADAIYLGADAELGPLDAQIVDRSGNSRDTSALETFKALEQLLGYSLSTLDALTRHLMLTSEMDLPHAIDRTQQLFAAIVTPLYQQIDPHELGEAGRYLSEGEDYAMHVMKRWGYRDFTEIERSRIARKLVWDYPSHGFVIDVEEAKDIGLHAHELDLESDILCKTIVAAIESTTGSHISLFLPEEQNTPQSDGHNPSTVDQLQEDTHAESPTANLTKESDGEDRIPSQA